MARRSKLWLVGLGLLVGAQADATSFHAAASSVVAENGELRVLVGPDHLFEEVRLAIDGATGTIDVEAYTLDHADLVDAIVARQRLGVRVRVLLDGEPLSGIGVQEKWPRSKLKALAMPASTPTGEFHRHR